MNFRMNFISFFREDRYYEEIIKKLKHDQHIYETDHEVEVDSNLVLQLNTAICNMFRILSMIKKKASYNSSSLLKISLQKQITNAISELEEEIDYLWDDFYFEFSEGSNTLIDANSSLTNLEIKFFCFLLFFNLLLKQDCYYYIFHDYFNKKETGKKKKEEEIHSITKMEKLLQAKKVGIEQADYEIQLVFVYFTFSEFKNTKEQINNFIDILNKMIFKFEIGVTLPEGYGLQNALELAIFLRSEILFFKGDLERCCEDFKRLIELNYPFTHYIYLKLAISNFYLKQNNDALKNFQMALNKNDDEVNKLDLAELFFIRSKVYFAERNYSKAFNDIAEAIKHEPKNSLFFYTKARFYRSMGNQNGSKKYFDEITENLTKAIQLDSNNPLFFNELGSCFLEQNKFEAAVKPYSIAIQLCPKNSYYYRNRAIAYFHHKDIDKALENLQQAIKLKDDVPEFFLERAVCFIKKEKYKLAKIDLDKMVSLDPKNANHYSDRAYWKGKMKQYDESLIDYKKSLKLEENPKAYMAMSEIYLVINKKELMEKSLNRAIEMYSDNIKTLKKENKSIKEDLYDITYCFQRMQEFRKPIKLLNAGRNDRPNDYLNDPFFYNKLGFYHLKIKEFKKALEILSKAIEMDKSTHGNFPNQVRSYANAHSGMCLIEMNQLKNAKLYLKRAIELDEEYFRPREYLGHYYLKKKKFKKAQQCFLKSIELDDFRKPHVISFLKKCEEHLHVSQN